MQQLELIPNLVVNSAGLAAQALTKRFHGINHRVIPPSHYARGCYFMLSGSRGPPFDHLVYPIPEEGGLGVHFTVDLTGQVKFGPDVEWIDGVDDISSFLNRFDYVVNPKRAEKFYPEIRKYYPELKDESLEPGYSGIRPKLSGPKQPPADFVIQGGESHGVHGLVNLFGIESPGFTSSLAIAEHIATRFLK
ncbi:PREDICTED: L-2-hydroxyglutarate dehydrogenase, mitochondrial-like [Tarenaya hassleriana]|nr:PREDICTED: L-2-hydroxyglutarate dehydrogenase, mitochondrial-like [Tarenaya hassleriana]